MPDKYHYGFDLGNGKDESCLTIFRDEEGDTQVVEAVLYGKQAESVLACLRSRDEQHRREVESAANFKVPCGYCKGDGFTAEHDTADRHGEYGECVSCPVQAQCEYCHATGWVVPFDVVAQLGSKEEKG